MFFSEKYELIVSFCDKLKGDRVRGCAHTEVINLCNDVTFNSSSITSISLT